MQKKYKLTSETRHVSSYTVYRIEALKSFSNVKKGDLGGFVESEYNLNHYGNCWVYDNADIVKGARVYGNAKIYNNVTVCNDAIVCDNARISGDVILGESSEIRGNTYISGDAAIFNKLILNSGVWYRSIIKYIDNTYIVYLVSSTLQKIIIDAYDH